MIFKPELCDLVLSRRKTVTRRPLSDNPRSPWWRDRCGLEVGRDYAVQPGRGKTAVGRVRVVAVDKVRLGAIDNTITGPDEAAREGFADRGEFVAYWKRLQGSFDRDEMVWRVEFELLCKCGCKEPVTSTRPHARYASDACRARDWKDRTGYTDTRGRNASRNASPRRPRPSDARIGYLRAVDAVAYALSGPAATSAVANRKWAEGILEPLLSPAGRRALGEVAAR